MALKDAAWRQIEPHLDGQRVSDCVDIAHIYHGCVWSRTCRSSIDVHMGVKRKTKRKRVKEKEGVIEKEGEGGRERGGEGGRERRRRRRARERKRRRARERSRRGRREM